MTTEIDNTMSEVIKEEEVTTNTQHDTNIKHVILNELTDIDSYGKYTGNTKWFNDKLGYGFITICDGEDKGKDIFVHHSGIKPLNSNYKTLRKGEYIQFNIITGLNGLQAIDVTGIKGGPLMCDYVTTRVVDNQSYQQRPSGNVEVQKTYYENGGDWQPVQRKHLIRRPYSQPQMNQHHSQVNSYSYPPQPPPPPPPHPSSHSASNGQYRQRHVTVGQKTQVKNTSKYNKQTRGKPT